MNKIPTLLSAFNLRGTLLKNRCVLASMSMRRCENGAPKELVQEFYTQRAGAGLQITDSTMISKETHVCPRESAIYTKEQIDGWREVGDRIHEYGSKMFMSLTHLGRAAIDGKDGEVLAPSPIKVRGTNYSCLLTGQQKEFPMPRKMTKDDIKRVLEQFRLAAENAKKAGLDGVVLDAGGGALIDSFIRSYTNRRKDEYGGGAEERCKFPLEVVDQLIDVWGKDRVGVKVTPTERYNDISDAYPQDTYSYLLSKLSEKGIAFVELMQTDGKNKFDHPDPKSQLPDTIKSLRRFFKGSVIGNGGFDYYTGNTAIGEGEVELISFAKLFLTNPDLVNRFANDWPVNPVTVDVWKPGNGPENYTDWKFYEEHINTEEPINIPTYQEKQ